MIALIPQALLAFAAAGFPTARTTMFPTMALQPAHLDELPAMYRERWRWHEDAERSATAATFERAPVSAVAWEEEAAEACIITEDKEVLQCPTNTARARPPPPPSSAVTISQLPSRSLDARADLWRDVLRFDRRRPGVHPGSHRHSFRPMGVRLRARPLRATAGSVRAIARALSRACSLHAKRGCVWRQRYVRACHQ